MNARFRIKKIVSGAETVVTLVSALPKETVSIFEKNQHIIHTIYSKGNVDDQKSQEILRLTKEMCAKVDEMQLEHSFVIRSDLPFSPSDKKLPEILWSACALWVLLKMCRNKLNHGDDRGFTIEELNIVIDVFITYTRYLYDRVNETRGNSSL